jgi:hypothetical protein
MKFSKVFLHIIIAFFSASIAFAQNEKVTIEFGPEEIAYNDMFTITITVQNGRLRSYDNFPDMPGFIKRGTSSSSNTNIINGQVSTSQSITQNYVPEKEGNFSVPGFKMKVNGNDHSHPGQKIKVGPAREKRDPFRDPFDDIFGRRQQQQPQDFVDIEDEAFLALTTDKSEVYLGEGFNATLAFYVAESNRAPLQFHDLGRQLSEILKRLKPSHCWEENFNIENINGETVLLDNKRYTQYKIYQAEFYPLNLDEIKFSSVGLEMIKYRVARNPSFFGRNRQEDYKTFFSKPKSVKVRDLPPHPLKDKVSVGRFRLEERINTNPVITGSSFTYEFNIYGEGNISALNKPEIKLDDNFDFYSPNIEQNIIRRSGKVTGSKLFTYFGIPNEPGEYDLSDYISLIYFDPNREIYDTLKSSVILTAIGESKKNQTISASDLGSFYDRLNTGDNTLRRRNALADIRLYANVMILVLVVGGSALIFKK